MADRGFNIAHDLKKRGVKLVIPESKGGDRPQLTQQEAAHSEYVAKARIYVQERKSFYSLDNPYPKNKNFFFLGTNHKTQYGGYNRTNIYCLCIFDKFPVADCETEKLKQKVWRRFEPTALVSV